MKISRIFSEDHFSVISSYIFYILWLLNWIGSNILNYRYQFKLNQDTSSYIYLYTLWFIYDEIPFKITKICLNHTCHYSRPNLKKNVDILNKFNDTEIRIYTAYSKRVKIRLFEYSQCFSCMYIRVCYYTLYSQFS